MKYAFAVFFCLILTSSHAQYWEAGTTYGTMNYVGDLQPGTPVTESFDVGYGVFGRWNFSPRLAFKASATAGSFSPSDAFANGNRKFRNLSCRTYVYELAATAEFNLAKYDVLDGRISAPYLFAGVAGFYFDPRARLNLQWYQLSKMGTEGQLLPGGTPYQQFQVAIPVGIGIKVSVHPRVNLGFELGFRQTFTDYLDDVSGQYPDLQALESQNPTAAALSFRSPELIGSKVEYPSGLQRGDSYKTDLYYYAGFTCSVNLASRHKMEFNKDYRGFRSYR